MKEEPHRIEGIHYSSGKAIRIRITDGLISNLEEIPQYQKHSGDKAKGLPVVAPGLTDLQINGYMGVDFNDPELTPVQIERTSKELLRTGVSTYYPTLITGSTKKISALLGTFVKATGQGGLAAKMIGGIHLEGPFISKEDGPRGAHSLAHCLDPDMELLKRWQEEANGKIGLLTLAPELPGSVPFIKTCVSMGIVVGIGHTAAHSDQIKSAVDAGATLSTHLGNGCHSTLPRHPNYIWEQLAQEDLYASMIADGFHLPDSVLKVFVMCKGEKAILISDGMSYTGMKPGVYDSSATGRVCLTPEGKLHQEGKPGTLAGSASTLLKGIEKMAGLVGFAKAWYMGSQGPISLINKAAKHLFQVGTPADLVLLNADTKKLEILKTFKDGFPID